MAYSKRKGDVEWRIPKRKRPIAYSTKAVSDLIVVLAENGGTIQEVFDQINYCPDAKAVLQAYISAGYGNDIARNHFR